MNKQQLANRIWASANNMRNKIDANEYKDYILGLIFYKFLSDTEVKYFIEDCEWEEDEMVELVENYEDMNMKNAIAEYQEHIGFFIEYKYCSILGLQIPSSASQRSARHSAISSV